MFIFTAILLGLIRGITEFLPVSSSGHLSILHNVFGLKYVEGEHLLFEALLDVAVLLAIFFAYKKELKAVFKETAASLTGKSEEAEGGRLSANVRTALFILIGTVPMLFVLPFSESIKSLSSNMPFVAFSLIITGTILFAAGKLTEGRKNEKTSTVLDVVLVGFAQAIATIPGVSVPGAVISVGLARGFRKSFAVKFAFFLSFPIVAVSALVNLVGAFGAEINWGAVPAYIVGAFLMTLIGYYAIIILRNLLKKDLLGYISRYCWAVGLVSLIASLFI